MGLIKDNFLKIFLSLACISLIACDRKLEETSKLSISFNSNSSQQSPVAPSGKVTTQSASVWGFADPTVIGDIKCYGIAVSGPEPDMQKHRCYQSDDTTVANIGAFYGTFPASGGNIDINVPSGPQRTVYIVGFAAANEAPCVNLINDPVDESLLSSPHILGQATLDLNPGAASVAITAAIAGATKFEKCDDFGAGVGSAPDVFIAGGPIFNYPNVVASQTTSNTFTFYNNTNDTLNSLSFSGPTSPFSVNGGTCVGSLGPQSSCTVIVDFTPPTVNSFTSNLQADYFVNGVSQFRNIGLDGDGATIATLTISSADPHSFGTVASGGNGTHLFTVTNTGGVTATGITESALAAPYEFNGGSFPGSAGTCGTTLDDGDSCTIDIGYSPTVVSPTDNGSIQLNYNNGSGPVNAIRTLTGTSVAPAALAIAPGGPYDFGNVTQGSSADGTFTITNNGQFTASALSGSGLSGHYHFKDGNTFPGNGGTCINGGTLAPAASCTVVVKFTPASAGIHNDTFLISYDNGATTSNTSRSVTGNAIAPAILDISNGPTYNFFNVTVGSTSTFLFTVTNTGGSTATAMTDGGGLVLPYSYVGGTYPGTSGTCGATLAAAGSCTIDVQYAPTVSGSGQTGTLDISYHDGDVSQTSARPLDGTGETPAVLTISDGPTYDYGNRASGSVTNHTFTITNTGESMATGLTGSGLAAPFTFPGGFPGTGGDCGSSLSGLGATCTVVVQYAPAGVAPHSDTLDINYNDGVAPQVSNRAIQGTGVAPAVLTISDVGFDYGPIQNGLTSTKLFTIANSGSFTAGAISVTGLAAPYNFVGGSFPGTGGDCTVTLAPAGTCTINIEFAPTVSSGTFPDTIDVNYNDGAAGQLSSRPITGSAIP